MRFDIITLLPEIFGSVFSGGVIKKALEKGLIEVNIHDLRTFARGRHRQVDDRPYGGGQGMVLMAGPIVKAVEKVRQDKAAPVFLLSPQGKKFDFHLAEEFARFQQIILICGRYEGVDERVVQHLVTDELSIGDYILTGGEPAAFVIVDAVARYVPEVVGKIESVKQDSFLNGLLDYPQYTRPRDFRGMKVPGVLFSGNHQDVKRWRRRKSLEKTWRSRPDILEQDRLSPEDKKLLDEIKAERKGKKDESD